MHQTVSRWQQNTKQEFFLPIHVTWNWHYLYKVTAVPTVYAFLDNAPVGSFQGAVSEPSLKRFLEELK